MKIYATIGLTRLPYTLGGETSGLTSPELEEEQAAISSHRKHIFAVADETSSLEDSFDENRANPMSLGDKPLMVLTAGSVELKGTGLSQEQINLIDKLHSRSQVALTRLSEGRRYSKGRTAVFRQNDAGKRNMGRHAADGMNQVLG
jgi:hypothetical protein